MKKKKKVNKKKNNVNKKTLEKPNQNNKNNFSPKKETTIQNNPKSNQQKNNSKSQKIKENNNSINKKQTGKITKNNISLEKEITTKKEVNEKQKLKKRANIKIIFIIIMSSILLSLTIILLYLNFESNKEQKELNKILQEKELINIITNHYNEIVKTNKEAFIYNDKEENIGKLNNNIEISLEEPTIDKNTKYFKIKDFDNSYIKYEDVDVIEKLTEVNNRYKNYIVFNENIITNDITTFYDENDNLVYEFNTSFDLPIIIKETDKYGVEFNNRLLYVKKDNVKETKYNYNTDLSNASGVAVLNYHAFYDENNSSERRDCVTSICHSKKQFKTHLDYLKEKSIFTLQMKEIEMYIDGKLQLPKSVLITIDDGPKTQHAIDLLTEYKMYATIFMITSWFDEETYYKTDYIEFHSHTHDLHDGGDCPGGQGGAIKCLNREILLEDLRKSREELNGTTAFCYPFYEYNEYSISVLKEAGFTMAFAGNYGDGLVKVGMDKFRLPRYVITTSTTIWGLDNYFNRIKS